MQKAPAAALGLVMGVVVVASVACSKKNDPPPNTAMAPSASTPYGQPSGQPGYPPAPSGYPAGSGAPGQLAVPGPAALPCQNDGQCVTHKCNVQYGKCAWPCASDVDCIQGSTCFGAGTPTASCIPKPPGQP